MPRRDRRDEAGAIHHVCNRALSRRTMFESSRDRRLFLALLACAVRKGEIRIYAFCVLSTHFHLLLMSVHGELAATMQRIQTAYSRYFNRTRKRDGPLVRGRFASKRVDSEVYFNAVVKYIDMNPVQAGLADRAHEYRFGSAFHILREAPWIASPRHEGRVRRPPFGEAAATPVDGLDQIIESRLRSDADDCVEVDTLFASTPHGILEWMRRKARLADGSLPGLPVCDPKTVLDVIARNEKRVEQLSRTRSHSAGTMVRTMAAGLLRNLCGMRQREIAEILGRTLATAGSLTQRHTHLVHLHDDYAARAAELARSALDRSPFVAENWKKSTDVKLQEEND